VAPEAHSLPHRLAQVEPLNKHAAPRAAVRPTAVARGSSSGQGGLRCACSSTAGACAHTATAPSDGPACGEQHCWRRSKPLRSRLHSGRAWRSRPDMSWGHKQAWARPPSVAQHCGARVHRRRGSPQSNEGGACMPRELRQEAGPGEPGPERYGLIVTPPGQGGHTKGHKTLDRAASCSWQWPSDVHVPQPASTLRSARALNVDPRITSTATCFWRSRWERHWSLSA